MEFDVKNFVEKMKQQVAERIDKLLAARKDLLDILTLAIDQIGFPDSIPVKLEEENDMITLSIGEEMSYIGVILEDETRDLLYTLKQSFPQLSETTKAQFKNLQDLITEVLYPVYWDTQVCALYVGEAETVQGPKDPPTRDKASRGTYVCGVITKAKEMFAFEVKALSESDARAIVNRDHPGDTVLNISKKAMEEPSQ